MAQLNYSVSYSRFWPLPTTVVITQTLSNSSGSTVLAVLGGLYATLKLIYSFIHHHHHRRRRPHHPHHLRATCLSYGSLRLSDFFQEHASGSDPSTDLHAKWLIWRGFTQGCAFCSKNRKKLYPWPPDPLKGQNLANFWKFLLDFAFNIGVSRVNTPYSSSEPNKGVILIRQCGGEKFKYVPKFYIGGIYIHAQWRFALDRHFGAEYLQKAWR